MVSLTQIREVPPKNMLLLVGAPGSGKTTFCEQAILQNLAMDRPIIYITTGYGSSKAEETLREKGLGRIEPKLLNFVDAYTETVGVSVPDRSDTVYADCNDLSSIDIAISKSSERVGRDHVLLVFDSLTSPYLFNGSEIFRFVTQTLSKFAAEGNSVIVSVDEGCGKSEDLVSLMSLSNGVVKIEQEQDKRIFNVRKYPKLRPARIEVSVENMKTKVVDIRTWDKEVVKNIVKGMDSNSARRFSVGLGVNVFWPNLARWSSISWDPKLMPKITYEFSVEWGSYVREMFSLLPRHMRLLVKLLLPRDFSEVKDMKKVFNKFLNSKLLEPKRYGIVEYLEDKSGTDEHYFRVFESFECCGLENVGTSLALSSLYMPGVCKGLEREEREWNAIETKCIGLGDPYCEFKIVPDEISELEDSLEKDISIIEKIQTRLMDQLVGFVLKEKPLVQRPKLGNNFFLGGEITALAMARERYRMAMRMGGAKTGKEVGEQLMDEGLSEAENVNRVLNFLEHCNVGKITLGKTLRIENSSESFWINFYTTKWEEPCCFFTTGFLNGFFSAVKNQHVKETKCIAMGNPYCEWEFR